MNSAVGEKYTAEIVQLFERQGPALYSGQHSLCLTLPCLHYIQRKFAAMQESSSEPVPVHFAALQQLQDCLGRIVAMKLIADRHYPLPPTSTLNLAPFKALQILTLKKVPVQLVTGLGRLRGQLRSLIIQRSQVSKVKDVVVKCGGDDSTSFAWSNLRELDLSNNTITELGDSLRYLPCVEKVNFSNNSIAGSAEGVECIDSVTFLHLGFNKLSAIPKFGNRAKYNLTVLSLRNNTLDAIEGIQELDSLVELDLTDNLLCKHSSLKPLHNLHNLASLMLLGNPLFYHNQHRLKTAENLSNLVNPSTFRLDGKKLSGAEKKSIPRSLTHYPASLGSAPVSIHGHSSLLSASMAATPDHLSPEGDDSTRFTSSVPATPQGEPAGGKRRRKRIRTVALTDSDDLKYATDNADLVSHTASSVPLVHEQRLQQLKDMHNQLQEKWLLSATGNRDNAMTPDEHSGSTAAKTTTGLEQNPSRAEQRRGSIQRKSGRSKRRSSTGSAGREVVGSVGSEGIAFSPIDRVSTPTGEGGECFLVERCESDVEGEVEAEQLLLTLTDRFLEEKSHTTGKTLDRLALHCLVSASVEQRTRRGGPGEEGAVSNVLVLRFSHERRDRQCREYVLLERDEPSLLSLLAPIAEQNQTNISLATRVECLKCQHVFDISQAITVPSDEPQPLARGGSFNGKRQSLSRLMCPLCHSQLLQYSTPRTLQRPSLDSSHSHSPKSQPRNFSVQAVDEGYRVMASQDNARAGFAVSNSNGLSPSAQRRASPTQIKFSDSDSISGSLGDSRHGRIQLLDMDLGFGDASPTGAQDTPSFPKERYNLSTGSNAAAAITNHGNGEADLDPAHLHRSPDDIIYPFDAASFGMPQSGHVNGPTSDPKTRLTHSEPLPTHAHVQRSGLGSIEDAVEAGSSPSSRREMRRYSSALEDRVAPWRPQKGKPLARFTDDYNDKFIREEPFGVLPASRGETASRLESTTEQPSLHETYHRGSRPSRDFDSSKSHSTNPFDDDCSQLSNPFDFASYDNSEQSEVDQSRSTREDSNPITSKQESSDEQRPGSWRAQQGRREALSDNHVFRQTPSVSVSTSVPSQPAIHFYMGGRASERQKSREESSLEDFYSGHRRSKSSDCHPVKTNKILQSKGRYMDPFEPPSAQSSRDSSRPSSRGSSPRGSQRSLESADSPPGSKGNIVQGYSSGERHSRGAHGFSSSEKLAQGYLSGEKPSRGYHSSGEKAGKSSAGTSSGSDHRGSSGRRGSSGSQGGGAKRRGSSGSQGEGSGRRGSSGSQGESRGSRGRGSVRSSGGGGRNRGSSDEKKASGVQRSGSHWSSSESGRKLFSPMLLFKDDDPEYIHNSLNLHLDMEVFSTEGEHFKMIFKAPVVQYGHSREVPAIVIVSNVNAYIFKITAPESSRPDKWLQQLASHPLHTLVYINIGIGYQFLQLEFDIDGACYTFLTRDEVKSEKCSTRLAYVVSDTPGSSFRRVSTAPFSLNSIKHPDRMLREVLMMRYDKICGSRTPPPRAPTPCRVPTPLMPIYQGAEPISLYILAHRYLPGKSQIPVTLVVSEDSVFLGWENFQQWPLPRLQTLPSRETLKPPFSEVEQRDITDIEQLALDRDQNSQIIVKFFKETISEGDSKHWILLMQTAETVNKLVAALQTPWEAQFQTQLPVTFN